MKVPTWIRQVLWRWLVVCLLPSAIVLSMVVCVTSTPRLAFVVWGACMLLVLAVILAVESRENR
jgi:hypothetical protein